MDELDKVLLDSEKTLKKKESQIIENEINNYIEKHESDNIRNDINLLIQMGFDKKMINKVYIILKPENIERAVTIMTQINGIYQHNFYENNYKFKVKNLCFICNEPKKLHQDYNNNGNINENNTEIITPGNFNPISNEEKENIGNKYLNINSNKICKICFEEFDEEEYKKNKLSS